MWFLNLFKQESGKCYFPLPGVNGRRPKVSSASKWENKSRPTHNGDDWMYRREKAGKPVDGGPAKRWEVPEGTKAICIRDGIVGQIGKIKTGYRVWITHSDGYRSGYFHLKSLSVTAGQFVYAGDSVGVVGDNPSVFDPRHLHFEISLGYKYRPVNPREYLTKHRAEVKWKRS